MRSELRKRKRRLAAERRIGRGNVFELDLSPEEILSDLNFGVGASGEVAPIVPAVRARGPHESN